MRRLVPAFAILLGLGTRPVPAQFGYFGQNRVQYRGFAWSVLPGPHVDVYHYPEETELARVALAYAESSYLVLERRFNHAVTRRIPLIIYASHTDFEQTNILEFIPPEELLGVTDFLKRRVTLPFTGNYADFRHTIRHELVHVFQLSLATQAYQRYPQVNHPGLPLWYTEGLAEYFSAGEDSRDEMVLRDFCVSGQLPTIEELTYASGGAIYALGGSIHRYLALTYGEWRIQKFYTESWKYPSFEAAMAGIYGRPLHRLSEEWQFWLRQKYLHLADRIPPVGLEAQVVTHYAIKPVAYRAPDSTLHVLYFSARSGYATIAESRIEGGGGHAREVVKGERGPQFESFHFWASRLDVNDEGVAVFGSRFEARDALFFYDVKSGRLVGRYEFPELISILGPVWAPDKRSVIFSGLTLSGYSDLYRMSLPDGRLERLTADRFQDVDPSISPDGHSVVFSSDRTPFGPDGSRNLFIMNLDTREIRYLTYGDWTDQGARWAADGRIWFTSDRDGSFQVYSVDTTGTGRRETWVQSGAFDPVYVAADSTLIFGGFSDLSFNIYHMRVRPDTGAGTGGGATVSLAADRAAPGWAWGELEGPQTAKAAPVPYRKHYTLDFATAGGAYAPGVGGTQGVLVVFSDLLNDHQVWAQVSSFAYAGSGFTNIFDNINASVFYLNQTHRINWGAGAFRLRGLFEEGDFFSQYSETSIGAAGQLRYPFDRFRRVEFETRLEHSDRFDYGVVDLSTEPHRVAWLASNYLSYVKDNALWLDTGPIDGSRFNFTGGLVNDLTHGRFDSYLLSGDVRRYFRTSLHSALALRGFVYYGGGERPRQISIGGSWGIRGYPYYGYVAGSRVWLASAEWRFPLLNFLTLGLPVGVARFPGIQGAFFFDAARAWTEQSAEIRGVLESGGFGLRASFFAPLVIRLDMGWRFPSNNFAGYGLPLDQRNPTFVIFFFGFNY